jgi:hypothetical protein
VVWRELVQDSTVTVLCGAWQELVHVLS